jgi:PadR family transcriptional regulator, regulatory protein PadR
MAMDPTIKRGSAELAILAVLEREPLHGYEIARRIEEQTGGLLRFRMGSLYPLLHRMEQRGWVKAGWERAAGRRRRCYRLATVGKKKLETLRAQWGMFFHALNRLAKVF